MFLTSLMLFAQLTVPPSSAPNDNRPWNCGTGLLRVVKETEQPLAGADRAPTHYQVGDTRMFWLDNMNVMPPQTDYKQATCRGVGQHCYVWVEDSSWNAGQVDSADIAFIMNRLEQRSPRDSTRGVWQQNTTSLGMPPDMDHDSMISIMYYDIGSFHGYTFDGFWYYFDEYPDSIAFPMFGHHSNECEVVYIDDNPSNPATDYRMAIVAHEFAHMIHFNYDQVESLWVNEGCAELAMWLYGSPDAISGFNANSNDDLIIWDGQWSDYIQTYMFFLYLYEQYGERVGQPLVKSIVADPYQSIDGINDALQGLGITTDFRDIFTGWTIANFMDDTLTYGGRYGYYGERIPPFSLVNNHTTYPVSQTYAVKRWAASYIRFSRGTDLTLGFDGADDAVFKAQVIARDTLNHTFVLDSIVLDSLEAGSISIPGFGPTYQQVLLVPTNVRPEGGQSSYHYTATVASGVQETPATPVKPSDLAVRTGANLLNIGYQGRSAGVVHLNLFNASGTMASQAEAQVRTGVNLLQVDVSRIPAGTYFLVAEQGSSRSIAKVAIVR